MSTISSIARAIAVALALMAATGCEADGNVMDTSADTISDTAGDTAADTAIDTPEDTAVDTVVDTPADTEAETADCFPPSTAEGSAGHSPGANCLTCHSSWYTVAGTVFSTAAGDTGVGGATIVVIDATGAEIDLVTHVNGNFFASQPVVFPLTVAASQCPDHQVMGSGATSGACNSCHGTGSRIHLP